MVAVKMSETYDLSTSVNTMGIIGIHTPDVYQVQRVWGNMMKAHQRFRYVSCDISIACASMLPADPLQIGTESGDIAPQDMFNPILYTAVSNDSWNTLQNRIMRAPAVTAADGTGFGTLVRSNVSDDAFPIYYSLLADPDGWKKAMPQSGLQMSGLYPICYTVLNTYGNTVSPIEYDEEGNVVGQTPSDIVGTGGAGGNPMLAENKAFNIRGPSVRMPSFPTYVPDVIHEGDDTFTQGLQPFDVPQTYVACIITPPAKLHKLYYRMRVTWTIEFTGIKSDIEQANFSTLTSIGNKVYGSDYATQSSQMGMTTSSVDTKDLDVELIMTSAS